MTTETTIETEANHIDFVALAAQLTNEQKILACLERIEVLLTPKAENTYTGKPPREEQIASLASKTMGTRRK